MLQTRDELMHIKKFWKNGVGQHDNCYSHCLRSMIVVVMDAVLLLSLRLVQNFHRIPLCSLKTTHAGEKG